MFKTRRRGRLRSTNNLARRRGLLHPSKPKSPALGLWRKRFDQ